MLIFVALSLIFSTRVIAKYLNLGNYYALLIGNQYYNHKSDWKDLKTPHADIDALAEILKDDFRFNVDIRKDLNRSEIIDLIEDYKAKLLPQDNFLIYYAGHGHLRKDGGYWIGVDGKKNSRGDWLKYTTISDLLDKNAGMKAKHVLVIADSCCYAGAAYREENDTIKKKEDESYYQWIDRLSQTRARIIISSGGEQPVVDHIGDSSSHSIFANELINRLRQIVKEKEVKIAYDLWRSIAPDVHHRTKRYIKNAQTPCYKKIPATGDLGGDFIFNPKSKQRIKVEETKTESKTLLSTRNNFLPKVKIETEWFEPSKINVLTDDLISNFGITKIDSIKEVANGRVKILPSGLIEFSPDDGFYGKTEFQYTVIDQSNNKIIGEAIIDVIRREKIILDENFINNEIGWPLRNDKRYYIDIKNGYLIFDNKTDKHIRAGDNKPRMSWWRTIIFIPKYENVNFIIESKIRKDSGDNERTYGIVWGFSNKTTDLLYFGINGNGGYDLHINTERDWWTGGSNENYSNAINKKNSYNIIKIKKSDKIYTFYINNQILGTASYKKVFGNGIGIGVEWGVKISVDSFRVTYF
jgi:hypothetical protein